MDELNKLTQRLFSEGYTKENYPDDVRPFDPFYGGFTYRPETLYQLVFETPCGLLVEGGHFVGGVMSFMGIHWMPENNNPVVACPHFTSAPCEQNHPLLRERRGEILHCACHLTDRPYSYEQSLEKAHAEVWKEADTLFEAFRLQKQGRVCKHRSRYNRMEKQWRMFYDPIDCAREGFCRYCDVLQTELSPKKGNVFYDVKISRTQKGVGLFPDETVVSMVKGKKLLDSSASLTLCEAIVRCCGAQIQDKEESRSYRERFFDPTYTVQVQNIRAEHRETRDLLQDLRDAAEGIEIVHAGDMQKAAAQKKRERKQAAQKRKIARLERLLLEKGLDRLEKADQRRIKKVLPAERIEELILQRQAPPSTAERFVFTKTPPYPIHKGCDPIICQKCLSTELIDPVDQSAVSCEYCGKDLSEAPEGTIICKGCADLRQLCQRCGRPLRLADFKGIFVGTGGARLHRGAEKQIIALLLGRQK